MTRLTVVLTTTGKDTLKGALHSLQGQLEPGDAVHLLHLGGDTRHVRSLWKDAQLSGRLVSASDDSSRIHALARISDGYVCHLSDDNILVPGALERIRQELASNVKSFFVFRAVHPDGLESLPGGRIERGAVILDQFVHPAGISFGNLKIHHDSGFDFIQETIARNPDHSVVWANSFTAIVQPHAWTKPYKKYFWEGATKVPAPPVNDRSEELEACRACRRNGLVQDTVILTSYFTTQLDHHHGYKFPSDAPELLLLAKTAQRRGIACTVFYDGLSDDFVQKHTSLHVSFVRVLPPENISNNDYRMFVYRDWLQAHTYKSVWCCDLFDVRLNRDPTTMLDDEHDLWIGIHRDWMISDSSQVGRWMIDRFKKFYPDVPEVVLNKPILMAGTFGGHYGAVRYLLHLLTAEHQRYAPGSGNYDMALFNLVAHRDLGALQVWMKGAPLHSEFRAYDVRADVCFVHK